MAQRSDERCSAPHRLRELWRARRRSGVGVIGQWAGEGQTNNSTGCDVTLGAFM